MKNNLFPLLKCILFQVDDTVINNPEGSDLVHSLHVLLLMLRQTFLPPVFSLGCQHMPTGWESAPSPPPPARRMGCTNRSSFNENMFCMLILVVRNACASTKKKAPRPPPV